MTEKQDPAVWIGSLSREHAIDLLRTIVEAIRRTDEAFRDEQLNAADQARAYAMNVPEPAIGCADAPMSYFCERAADLIRNNDSARRALLACEYAMLDRARKLERYGQPVSEQSWAGQIVPDKPGWWWRRYGDAWEPVEVCVRLIGVNCGRLVWGAGEHDVVVDDGRWDGPCLRRDGTTRTGEL